MCPSRSAPRRKFPTPMTIQRASGARRSAPGGENLLELVRRHDLELRISAVARFLVEPPSSKMRHVPEPRALHVLVSDLAHQLRPHRLPRQVLPLTPPALPSRHTLPCLFSRVLRP